MYLFDASSMINLIKRGVVVPIANGATIELALYESVNAIWKEHKILKKLDAKLAQEFLDILSSIFRTIKILSIKGFEKEIFDFALQEDLTTYDAAYAYIAKTNNLILVTDDQKLRNKASKHLKAVSSSEVTSS